MEPFVVLAFFSPALWLSHFCPVWGQPLLLWGQFGLVGLYFVLSAFWLLRVLEARLHHSSFSTPRTPLSHSQNTTFKGQNSGENRQKNKWFHFSAIPRRGRSRRGRCAKLSQIAPNLRKIAGISFRTSEEGCAKLSQICREFEMSISDNFMQTPLFQCPLLQSPEFRACTRGLYGEHSGDHNHPARC